jgi:hypothetical protein
MSDSVGIGELAMTIIIFVCVVASAVWIFTPDINHEIRHITVKDKCCNMNGKCFVFDSTDYKYSISMDVIYDRIVVGESYHATIFKGKFFDACIVHIVTDSEYNQTCEAKGLDC